MGSDSTMISTRPAPPDFTAPRQPALAKPVDHDLGLARREPGRFRLIVGVAARGLDEQMIGMGKNMDREIAHSASKNASRYKAADPGASTLRSKPPNSARVATVAFSRTGAVVDQRRLKARQDRRSKGYRQVGRDAHRRKPRLLPCGLKRRAGFVPAAVRPHTFQHQPFEAQGVVALPAAEARIAQQLLPDLVKHIVGNRLARPTLSC